MATGNGEQNGNQNLDKKDEAPKNGSNENDSEPTELETKIIEQVEFYFGDINLPQDKFMLEKIKLDDGWIPMSVMLAFHRLAKLTTDPKVIAKALFHSDLMEVDESGSEIKIRRSPEHPLPELDDARRKALLERSVYCARFPENTEMNTLLEFFAPYGPIDNLIKRKYKDKVSQTRKFKGSVFVTFRTKEKGQEFLNLESVKYQDTELTKMWQMDYLAGKKREMLENKLKRGKKGEEKGDSAVGVLTERGLLDTMTHVFHLQAETQIKSNFARGAIIHLSGNFDGITREIIREKFTSMGYEPAYIEFKVGETEARVRFGEENAGKNFIEKNGSEVEMPNGKLTARLLEGDEENAFLETALANRNAALKRVQQQRKGGRKGKKGKGGNKGGYAGKKRKIGSADGDGPPSKKPVEA